ncbi:PPC domain-containing protein [Streptomyces sp. MAR4 CNY-716]
MSDDFLRDAFHGHVMCDMAAGPELHDRQDRTAVGRLRRDGRLLRQGQLHLLRLGHYRAGNWSAARSYLTGSVGSRHDVDWYSWLTACAAGECGGGGGGGGVTGCTGADTRQMDRTCRRSGVSAAAGDSAYFYLHVPAGTRQLKITATGGTGNADLYYNSGTWGTTGGYTSRSTGPDNSETLTVSNPPAGYNHLSLAAAADFSGATVTTEY